MGVMILAFLIHIGFWSYERSGYSRSSLCLDGVKFYVDEVGAIFKRFHAN
jgi:hypothetical protein